MSGKLTKKQVDRFIDLACDESRLLKDTKTVWTCPRWQIPIRATIGRLAFKVKFYTRRWEYLDADEEPRHAELVRSVADWLEKVERFLIK
jgi:hypothetical protein